MVKIYEDLGWEKPLEPPKHPMEIAKNLIKEYYGKKEYKNSKFKKKEKIQKLVGFFLEAHFGRPVWTIKDLSEAQLCEFIVMMNNKLLRNHCCDKHF